MHSSTPLPTHLYPDVDLVDGGMVVGQNFGDEEWSWRALVAGGDELVHGSLLALESVRISDGGSALRATYICEVDQGNGWRRLRAVGERRLCVWVCVCVHYRLRLIAVYV